MKTWEGPAVQERKKQLRGQRFAQTTGLEIVHAKALLRDVGESSKQGAAPGAAPASGPKPAGALPGAFLSCRRVRSDNFHRP